MRISDWSSDRVLFRSWGTESCGCDDSDVDQIKKPPPGIPDGGFSRSGFTRTGGSILLVQILARGFVAAVARHFDLFERVRRDHRVDRILSKLGLALFLR